MLTGAGPPGFSNLLLANQPYGVDTTASVLEKGGIRMM